MENSVMNLDLEYPGLEFVKSDKMVGQKVAVRIGDTAYVSPAVYDLFMHSNDQELHHLLANLEVIIIRGMDIHEPLHTILDAVLPKLG